MELGDESTAPHDRLRFWAVSDGLVHRPWRADGDGRPSISSGVQPANAPVPHEVFQGTHGVLIGNGSDPGRPATPRSSWAANPASSSAETRCSIERDPAETTTRSTPPSPQNWSSPCAHAPPAHPKGPRLVHKSAPSPGHTRRPQPYRVAEPATMIKARSWPREPTRPRFRVERVDAARLIAETSPEECRTPG